MKKTSYICLQHRVVNKITTLTSLLPSQGRAHCLWRESFGRFGYNTTPSYIMFQIIKEPIYCANYDIAVIVNIIPLLLLAIIEIKEIIKN